MNDIFLGLFVIRQEKQFENFLSNIYIIIFERLIDILGVWIVFSREIKEQVMQLCVPVLFVCFYYKKENANIKFTKENLRFKIILFRQVNNTSCEHRLENRQTKPVSLFK